MRKKIKIRKEGIVYIQNISPRCTTIKIINYLKKFGKIKRTFFFNISNPEILSMKKLRTNFAGLIEFTKKINAKRLSVLITFFKFQSNLNIPFKNIFYLKHTKWETLVWLFNYHHNIPLNLKTLGL